jgi:hypothetical protein
MNFLTGNLKFYFRILKEFEAINAQKEKRGNVGFGSPFCFFRTTFPF